MKNVGKAAKNWREIVLLPFLAFGVISNVETAVVVVTVDATVVVAVDAVVVVAVDARVVVAVDAIVVVAVDATVIVIEVLLVSLQVLSPEMQV